MGKTIAYGELTVTNLTEPFSVILTNEAQQFSTNASRLATTAQSYYTDIIVYQGATQRADYSIGNISSANGITVSKSSSRVTFTVSANTTISADTGSFTIPITLDGKTVNKTFSWSCTKQGISGSAGASAKAIDITASSQVFKSTDGGLTFAPDTIKLAPVFQGGLTFSKWQYSTNGGTTWTDVTSGSHGLTVASGVLIIANSSDLFTDSITTLSFKCISNNASYFDIMTIIKLYDVTDIQIGGRNLLMYTAYDNLNGVNNRGSYHTVSIDTSNKQNGRNSLKIVCKTVSVSGSQDVWQNLWSNLTVGDNLILSFWVKGSVASKMWCRVGGGATVNNMTNVSNKNAISITTEWKKVTLDLGKCNDAGNTGAVEIIYGFGAVGTFWINSMKLEIGNKATDWTPAPEDFENDINKVTEQILENKTTINNVSQTVDKQKQEIESKVSSDVFNDTVNVLQNNIDKASQGLGKWLVEIYPKTLFNSADRSKYDMSVFTSKSNLIPNQSLLVDDAKLSHTANYGDNYIGYGLTFVECDAAFSITTKVYYNDAFNLYLNNGLVGTGTSSTASSGVDVKINFRKGWNCLEIVWNETTGTDGFEFGSVLSHQSHIISMNCYYASITGRQSQIVNRYADLKINIDGISSKVAKTETDITTLNGKTQTLTDQYSAFQQDYNGFKETISSTVTELDKKTTSKITNIETTIDGITQRVEQTETDVDNHTTRITSAEQKLTTNGLTTIIGNYYSTPSDVSEKIDKLEIGGRNFILNSDFRFDIKEWDEWSVNPALSEVITLEGKNWLHMIGNSNTSFQGYRQEYITLVPNTEYVLSMMVYGVKEGDQLLVMIHRYGDGNNDPQIRETLSVDPSTPSKIIIPIESTDVESKQYFRLMIGPYNDSEIYLTDIKLEKGNKATDWTPAHEDTENKIANVQTIAEQTSDKFNWVVKSGTDKTNFILTDRTVELLSTEFNIDALTTFKNSAEDGTYTVINGGAIKTNTITANQIAANAITADKITANAVTAEKIATDAIKSQNYSYSSGNYSNAGTFLNLSNGQITSKNFAIDASGNAYLKGRIEATSGQIANWTIGSGSIYNENGNYSVYLRNATNENKDYLTVRVKQSDGSYSYPFFVRGTGEMYAENATISGNIFAKTITAKEQYGISIGSNTSSIPIIKIEKDNSEDASSNSYFAVIGIQKFSGDYSGYISSGTKVYEPLYIYNSSGEYVSQIYERGLDKVRGTGYSAIDIDFIKDYKIEFDTEYNSNKILVVNSTKSNTMINSKTIGYRNASSVLSSTYVPWEQLSPASGFTNGTYGKKGIYYRKIGCQVFIDFSIIKTAAYDGENATVATLPEGYRPSGNEYFFACTSGARIARFFVSSGGLIKLEWVKTLSDGKNDTTTKGLWYQASVCFSEQTTATIS